MSKQRQKVVEMVWNEVLNLVSNANHAIDQALCHFDLSRREYQAMAAISQVRGGLNPQDLAGKLRVTPGAVTQLVDRMIEKRLVERVEDQHDGRSVRLMISPNARFKLRRAEVAYSQAIDTVLDKLGQADLSRLGQLLRKLWL